MAEAERDDFDEFDLLYKVYLYIVEKRYSKECTATRKRQIRKKAEKFVVKLMTVNCFIYQRKISRLVVLFFVKSVTNTFTI